MKNRYLTFTFDDGFIDGAKKIDKILEPYKATFYLVTGWIKPNNIEVKDEYNIGLNHGSIEDWKKLAKSGHDIGSHSVTHDNPDVKEFTESLEFIKQFQTIYSVAFPHNKVFPVEGYNTIRIGYTGKIYNSLDVDLYNIGSWNPWTQTLPLWRIKWKVNHIPNNSWIVLCLHSLDDEGYHPWTSKELKEFKDYILKKGFQIRTMAEMYKLLWKKSQ